MLLIVILVLLTLWGIGIATSFTAGGIIHVLLVIALAILIIHFIRGRRAR